MSDVNDVAAAIVAEFQRQYQAESITTLKLQKLVYYAQAWHLADTGVSLFDDPIEAWRDGPVVRALFEQHRGTRNISIWECGQADRLPTRARGIIASVVTAYGRLDPETLVKLTHREQPWRVARQGLADDDHSNRIIDVALMASFYGRQRSSPKAALAFAHASARLEGGVVTAAVANDIEDVAFGRLSADDAVRRRLTLLHR